MGYRMSIITTSQGVRKRCRLSLLLANSALVYEPKCGWEGGNCGVSANKYSCAHHVTRSPNELWRSTSIFTYNTMAIQGLLIAGAFVTPSSKRSILNADWRMISSGFGSGSGSYLSSHSESGSGSYPKTLKLGQEKITNYKNFYRFNKIFLGNNNVVYDDVIQKFIKCIYIYMHIYKKVRNRSLYPDPEILFRIWLGQRSGPDQIQFRIDNTVIVYYVCRVHMQRSESHSLLLHGGYMQGFALFIQKMRVCTELIVRFYLLCMHGPPICHPPAPPPPSNTVRWQSQWKFSIHVWSRGERAYI